jgi:hypothetical protein
MSNSYCIFPEPHIPSNEVGITACIIMPINTKAIKKMMLQFFKTIGLVGNQHISVTTIL